VIGAIELSIATGTMFYDKSQIKIVVWKVGSPVALHGKGLMVN
jgi:hypothetical protein